MFLGLATTCGGLLLRFLLRVVETLLRELDRWMTRHLSAVCHGGHTVVAIKCLGKPLQAGHCFRDVDDIVSQGTVQQGFVHERVVLATLFVEKTLGELLRVGWRSNCQP